MSSPSGSGRSSEAIELRPLGMRQNFVWTACGNVAFAISQWGAVVVLARTLDASAVGEWALAFALTTPAFMLSNLQLRTVHVTDVEGRFDFSRYLCLRLISIGATLLVVLAFALVRGAQGLAFSTILVIGAAKAVESSSDILYALFQKQDRMDLITRSLLLRGPLALGAMTWILAETRRVDLAAAALALVWLAVLTVHDIPTATRFSQSRGAVRARFPVGQVRSLAPLFRLALPLGVVTGLVALNASIPRYFMEAFRGPAELGVFSAMAYCVMAGGLIVNALGQSVVARLSRLYAARDERGFRRSMIGLVSIGVGLAALAIAVAQLAGGPILSVLYGRDYAVHADAFVMIVIGGSIGYVGSFLGYGMTAARFFRVQAPLFAVLAGLNGLTCLALVPGRGLMGAALATVVTALAGLALSLAVNLRALRDLRA